MLNEQTTTTQSKGSTARHSTAQHGTAQHTYHRTKALDEATSHDSKNEGAASRAVEEKQKEEFVVIETNAVGDPRTMVIHTEYAATIERERRKI